MSGVALGVRIGTLDLPSPVLPASGTFGIGHARAFDLSRLGAIVPKTVTPAVRAGHPAPRLVEAAGGLINAIGIPSVGIAAFVETVLPRYAGLGPPLIASLSADTADAFAGAAAQLAEAPIDGLELNLSCPNLEAAGDLFAANPEASARVVAACRAVTSLPLWCKLSAAASRPADVARAIEVAGADALILTNTFPAMALDAAGRPRLANRTGGLSGAPLKPIVLRLVDDVRRATALPLIGCGGISTLRDALDYFAVGCSAVAVGTATLVRPRAMDRLIDDLAAHCAAHGLAAHEVVGGPAYAPATKDKESAR
ncbi:MAG: dihydroorotate dehydrogenase [Acuticoccus sp.]